MLKRKFSLKFEFFFLDLFRLFFDLFRFRVRFRSILTGLNTSWLRFHTVYNSPVYPSSLVQFYGANVKRIKGGADKTGDVDET